ncbi:hypothetical protein Tola_1141 [Tolumonas auensis DSM 9187]|uniref:LRAT domain-containing protein n=1 Tax=Tolumonas auensis (strain DSM 9187 / NBRC 110442 / TA 4) TaxID=595494 RepID=C4LDH1_TOLAT|nr:lecithin retinol acyltransferase family protein [Tolumonas auensis]ACQ92767.1 hypothetical protein Tola_1141 [Tolumonas auensis DSM 9187]
MQIGDHVVTPRIGYTHHGLYLGNKEVIHYEGSSLGDLSGRITQVSLEQFCQGNGCTVREYPIRIYGRKESVQRAYTRLGEAQYDVLLNNCEQFVTWCIMGFAYSEQINELVALGIVGKSVMKSLSHQAEPVAMAGYLATQSVNNETVRHTVQAVLPASSSLVASTAGASVALSSGTALVSSGLTITSVTPLAMPIVAGVVVGYGIKKVIDWVWDEL